MDIGVGGTSRAKVEDIHHIVEKEENKLNLEMLNAQGKRTGMVIDTIDKETFLSRFFPVLSMNASSFPGCQMKKGKKEQKNMLKMAIVSKNKMK